MKTINRERGSMDDLKITNFLTEAYVMDLFDMDEKQLGRLRREKKLPHVRLSKNRRVYHENDLAKWLAAHRENIPE